MVAAMMALAVTGAAGATEHSYEVQNADYSVSAGSDSGAETIWSAAGVTYDGSTKIRLEVYVPRYECASSTHCILNLYDGSTDLGRFAYAIGPHNGPVTAVRYLTPTAASHAYSVRAWKSGSSFEIRAGAGGGSTLMPAYFRVSSESAGGGGGADWSTITGKPTFDLSWLEDVDTTGAIDGTVLKYDEAAEEWQVATDDAGGEGSSGPVTLSAGDRERLDLNWWGVWAIVGLLLVLMIAPQLMSVMRITRGMADGRG